MAVWQRKPKDDVLAHSDQVSQYAGSDYLVFMKVHNLILSISRRGNCHDNAVAESFFATFKKRMTKRKNYLTRKEEKSEIFNWDVLQSDKTPFTSRWCVTYKVRRNEFFRIHYCLANYGKPRGRKLKVRLSQDRNLFACSSAYSHLS